MNRPMILTGPDGYTRVKPPSKNPHRSKIWEYGVRYSMDDCEEMEGSTIPHKWYCLANESCRDAAAPFSINHKSASRAVEHLREVHAIESDKTNATAKNHANLDEQIEHEEKQSKTLKATNPRRFHGLSWVKNFIIGCLLAFSLGEKDPSKVFFKHNCKSPIIISHHPACF